MVEQGGFASDVSWLIKVKMNHVLFNGVYMCLQGKKSANTQKEASERFHWVQYERVITKLFKRWIKTFRVEVNLYSGKFLKEKR